MRRARSWRAQVFGGEVGLGEARGRLVAVGGAEDKEGDCVILKEFVRLAKGAKARVVGMDICGVDLVLRDISEPALKGRGGVIELNAAPGLRMHLSPSACATAGRSS